jgi:hypothetical protein
VHNLQLTIPAQNSERPGVRIKPREVRSWLDNLPFLDLQRTARLAREQLRLMNRQPIPAAARLEILGDFLAIYQRLTEAMSGRARVDDGLQTVLKHLCQDIGFGYKIVANGLVNKRSRLIETRNLPLALLGAIHTLGLQLLDCYAGYRRAPRALWSECLALYGYAWQSGREKYLGPLPGFGEQEIDASFRLVALLRLADPYRLPAGTVVPLRRYLLPRIDQCAIHSEPPPDSTCCFSLKEAFQQPPEDQDTNLYLDLDRLLATMDTDIARLAQYRQAQAIGLPPEVAATPLLRALKQTLEHWRHHPTRSAERVETHARIDLVSGLSAAYCMVNHGRCFDPSLFVSPGQDQAVDLGAPPAPDSARCISSVPVPFSCTSINRSSGGLAVRYRGLQTPHPRVGQLLALRRPAPQSNAGWVVAVCRWLVEPEADNGFELGLEYLAREPRAVVIRVTDDRGHSGDYQAAIAATQRRGEQRVQTLITGGVEILAGSLVTIFERGRQQQVHCIEQLESGLGFERFIYVPAE